MRSTLLVLTALLLGACGGSSGSGSPAAFSGFEVGVIVDAPIQGLRYRSSSTDGTTNERGEYLYQEGDSVSFELAGYEFRPTQAQPVVTIVDLFDSGLIDRSVLNLARLLQSLDSNDLTPDVIELPDLSGLDLSSVDFDVPTDDFALVTEVRVAVARVRDELVSSEGALAHLEEAFADVGRDVPALMEEGDTDGDGIDDLVDSDDDNDGVRDLNNGQPLPPLDIPAATTPPIDNTDSDNSSDSDGDSGNDEIVVVEGDSNGSLNGVFGNISNISSSFRDQTDDRDRDDIPDVYDFFPDQRANIFYVDVTGVDIGDCSSANSACATISYAASLASPGDLVQVFGGDYVESNTIINTDLLTIQGLGSTSTMVHAAAPDSEAATPILTIAPGLQVQITKLSLINGRSEEPGSAVSASGGITYLRAVRISGTTGGGSEGSAVYQNGGVISLQEVQFGGNLGDSLKVESALLEVNLSEFDASTATEGSHIHLTGGSAFLTRNLFTDNGNAPAVQVVAPAGDVRIDNSTFRDNLVAIGTPEAGLVFAHHITVRSRFNEALLASGANLQLHNSYVYEASCAEPLAGGSANLLWNDSCGTDAGFNIDAPIGAISDVLSTNGGLTRTLALSPESPAVDAVQCPARCCR